MNAPHPVKAIEDRCDALDMRDKLKRVRAIYGSHMAMRIATEKVYLAVPVDYRAYLSLVRDWMSSWGVERGLSSLTT